MARLVRKPTFRRTAAEMVQYEIEQQLKDELDSLDDDTVNATSTESCGEVDYDTDLEDEKGNTLYKY